MTAVYKRELRSYFTSMVGYVFIAILIFLCRIAKGIVSILKSGLCANLFTEAAEATLCVLFQ